MRPLKRGSIHMKFSMTGQEKGWLLIQVKFLKYGFFIAVKKISQFQNGKR
jgi:hypothetical protein